MLEDIVYKHRTLSIIYITLIQVSMLVSNTHLNFKISVGIKYD